MQNLKTDLMAIPINGMNVEYEVKEKDHGDLLVYDVFLKDRYLLTLSKEGEILFMNFDANESEKEIFKLAYLNQFIEKIKNLP